MESRLKSAGVLHVEDAVDQADVEPAGGILNSSSPE